MRPTGGEASRRGPCSFTQELKPSTRSRKSVECFAVCRNASKIALCMSYGIEADLMTETSPSEIVGLNMNASPQARLPSFVGSIEIRSPLQTDFGAGSALEQQEGIFGRNEFAEAAWKVRAAGDARHGLGRSTTERAVSGDERRKRRSNERASLIGD